MTQTTVSKDKTPGLGAARAWYTSIVEMVEELEAARDRDDCGPLEAAEQTIQESVLAVNVRNGWHTPGSGDTSPIEYRILLATGGPAVQIIGEFYEHSEPQTARLESQDWFRPWTEVPLCELCPDIEYAPGCYDKVREILLTFARCFYFDEE